MKLGPGSVGSACRHFLWRRARGEAGHERDICILFTPLPAETPLEQPRVGLSPLPTPPRCPPSFGVSPGPAQPRIDPGPTRVRPPRAPPGKAVTAPWAFSERSLEFFL